jgi:lipopolysaccharide/colanic/teichoic acid biosynthesis glycosyltransferase
MNVSLSSINMHASLPTMIGVERRALNAESFNRMISLERKRTERSQSVFLLMLLDISRVLADDKNELTLGRIMSALLLSFRETDSIGWHKKGAVVGIMFTDVLSEARKSIVSRLLLRVNAVMYPTLTFEQFNQISISYHVFPEEWDLDVPQRPSHPVLYPDLAGGAKRNAFFFVAKRTMDVIGSALGLLVSLPFFLVIALAIKLSSRGPVFFRQQRVGRYGKPFVFLKFRSMRVNSDSGIHREFVRQLIRDGAAGEPSNGQGVYKLTGDPRVTRVGAFLRKTSLDELPQLYNVLKGEMSLVGPRPAIPYEVEAYDLWHRRRVLEAKPGITGLWQVKGRSRVSFDEMVRLDVRYAMARSLWFDIKILLSTPRAVISGDGAY